MAGPTGTNASRNGSRPGAGSGRVGVAVADDYYKLLGVPYDATQADITAAYRRTMKENHPDRQIGRGRAAAEETAKSLNLAYATLSKPDKRRAYDQTIRQQIVQDQIMGRYVGGFPTRQPRGRDGVDPYGQRLRRNLTERERRERRQADRNAILTVVAAFGGLLVVFLVILLLYAIIDAII